MPKTNVEIVQELLKGITKSEVVNRLVSPDAVYVSLSYDNPDLKKLMPWAGTHKDGQAAILKTFQDVNTFWTIEDFDVRDIFGEGENVAVFGSFTVHSVKLDKTFTSPFSIQLKLKDGLVTYMQYMEDTFGTGSTFRSSGIWKFQSDPKGGEVEVGT
ncbi:nuclear transport factor 2 family protein [Nostoc sp. UHCC 0926]|uniref:nuclear transport factor 2 family protein n=1 Tax=unclassified Nostoc TaxID=2593658 RepID=UPI0023627ED6|nr:nuclear transport factor 2 family protein [Nostoc sp. UHCC 0926]WDD32404.1 nuclear transport factor 2 family protein [Nostoc sp. UHCC 0926]